MDEILETVPSQQGNVEFVARGYIMVKEKNIANNQTRWCCEYRKSLDCNGSITTELIGYQYYLVRFKDHNHTAEAHRAPVKRATAKIKEMARNTNDPPCVIIQTIKAKT